MPETSTLTLPWTPERLQQLEAGELDSLARGAGRSLVMGRLVIGRCMLEMERRGLPGEWGFSGSVHYAARALKLSRKVANDVRRVARELLGLPRLTSIAEAGEIGWGHLREIVRVATPDTEAAWLEAAQYPWHTFHRLVSRANPGELPGGAPAQEQKGLETELRLVLDEDRRDLMQAAMARLARELGSLPSVLEALDYAWAEILDTADGAFAGKREKARELLQELKELREREEQRQAKRAHRKALRTQRRAARRAAAAAGGPARAEEDAAADDGPARAQAEVAVEAGGGPAALPDGPARAHADVAVEAGPTPRVMDHALPRPPFAYPAVSDGADLLRDQEPPYGEDLAVPWDMVSAGAVPYPGAPGLRLTVPDRAPSWEGQEAGPAEAPGHEGCSCSGGEGPACGSRHGRPNREARRAAAIHRGAHTRRGSAETRRTVLRRDRFRCLCPDCPNSIWLHLHHLTMYCLGGPSIPENEIALCSRCHRNAHERGRLVIRGTLEEGLEWFDGSGRPLGEASEEVQRRSEEYARGLLAVAGL